MDGLQKDNRDSTGAEQHLIACALIDDTKTAELLEINEDWFSQNAHKLIIRTIRELTSNNLAVNSFAVGDHLNQANQINMVGGMEYLVELEGSLPSLSMWGSYKNSLFNYYKLRMIEQLSNNLTTQLNGGYKPEEIIEGLQTNLIDLLTDHHNGGFKKVGDYLSEVIEELQWREDNKGQLLGQKSGFNQLDYTLDGWQDNRVYVIAGRPGCLSGETKLYVSRKGSKGSGRYYTLAELYRGMNGERAKKGSVKWNLSIPTMVQSLKDDDLTGLNVAEEIIYSGVKKTYTVTTKSGKEIRATKDHMFLTDNGFTALSDLVVGNTVICKAPHSTVGRKYKQPYRKEICTKLPYSPYPTRIINGCEYHRVLEQRVSYDAAVNFMNMQEFLEVLKTDPDHNLVFSDASKHIHHKDGNPKNNSISNLELLTSSDHTKEHAKEEKMNKRFGKNLIHSEGIVSIELYGEEDTYDVVCADPYNNFIAQGFVTHNSGKTAFALALADGLTLTAKPWFFFSLEMSGKSLTMRMLVRKSGVSNNNFRAGSVMENHGAAIGQAFGEIQDRTLNVDQSPGLAIAQIRSRLKAAQVRHGIIGGIMIDHIGLVKKDPRKSDTESMNIIADELLVISKEFECPMVELCQLNRGVEGRQDKRPMMSDLKQSGKIEENADVVILLYREDYYDKDATPVTEVNVAKNRDGESKVHYLKHDLSVGSYEQLTDYVQPEQTKRKL